jgi:hypothetical protein
MLENQELVFVIPSTEYETVSLDKDCVFTIDEVIVFMIMK